MNRNVLKIIALITMLIDHIGYIFFPNILIFRIFGRLAFPIFAFFIAEGYYYTKSRKKYVFLLLVFMIVSWLPFCLAFDHSFYVVNVLGVFLLSILAIFLIERVGRSENLKFTYIAFIIVLFALILFLDTTTILPEGLAGVLLPVVFYYLKDKPLFKYLLSTLLLIIMALRQIIVAPENFASYIQLFALLSLVIIYFYNNQKGKLNLKYLFYISYPLHLTILYLIKIFVI